MSSFPSVPLQGFFICLTIALVRCAQRCGRESDLTPVTKKKKQKSLLPRGLDFFLLQRLDLSGLRQHLALVGFWTLVGIGDLDFTRAVNDFSAIQHMSLVLSLAMRPIHFALFCV